MLQDVRTLGREDTTPRAGMDDLENILACLGGDQHEDRRFGKRRFEFHDEIEFVAVENAAIQQHYVIGIGLLRYFESALRAVGFLDVDRKSTRMNSSH